MENKTYLKKPEWIKVKAPGSPGYNYLKEQVENLKLSTVCQEARCPNIGECWSKKTLTLMIMGDTCTRFCKFCNVKTGKGSGFLDEDEPANTAKLLKPLKLRYVVITSVDRDDLPDGGASHFAKTILEVKKECEKTLIEVLTGDFSGNVESLEKVILASPHVFAHNIETVRRLSPSVRDPRAKFDTSLQVLSNAKKINPNQLIKSSIMVGLGESETEILEALSELRSHKVDFLTIGQYLQPSNIHLPVKKFYTPEGFASLAESAKKMGFLAVASGPLVRSSYKAGELYFSTIENQEISRCHS